MADQKTQNGIRRRDFLKTGGGALAASSSGLAALGCAAQKKAPPNILLIITDQQHHDSISARGCRFANTPSLDSLAERATSFANSYCADSLCSPSRSAIFTGRTPSEAAVPHNGMHIRRDIPNMGQWFSENSEYETVYAGKWHLPRTYQDKIEGFRVLPGGIGGQGNVGDTSVSRAVEAFLRNRTATRPFLLTASFLQPHDICEWLRLNMKNPDGLRYPELQQELPPLPDNFDYETIEPQALRERRQRNEPAKGGWSKEHWRYYRWSYFRHVEMVDGEIGRILLALEDTGHVRDTVVVFIADHGEGLGHHQMVRKSSPYDEASRVPFLISWPGYFPEGRNDARTLVNGVDVMPTLCDCAGIRPPANMRGRSLRPVLEGKADNSNGYVVTEIPVNIGRVVRSQRYKYVTYAGDTVEQLFDMVSDPGETRNLAADAGHAAALAEHKRLLREWEARLDPAPKLPHADAWWRTS